MVGITRSKVIWRVSCFIGNYEFCPVQAMQFGYSWCQWPHPYLQGIPSYRVEMSVTHTRQVSHKEFSYVFVVSRRFTLKSRQELTHQIFCWSPLQCFLPGPGGFTRPTAPTALDFRVQCPGGFSMQLGSCKSLPSRFFGVAFLGVWSDFFRG